MNTTLKAEIRSTCYRIHGNRYLQMNQVEAIIRALLTKVAEEQRRKTLDYVSEVVSPVPFSDHAVPLVTEGP